MSDNETANLIHCGERLDDLQCAGLFLIQNPKLFCFGVDAVLLSDFANVKRNAAVLDLCTGNGIIPVLLSGKTNAGQITCAEIQQQSADLAQRNVLYNQLEHKISVLHDDIKNLPKRLPPASFDVVTCNPPYKEVGAGLKNPSESLAIARHEVFCNLDDIFSVVSKLIKPNGKFSMIHRPERLAEIIVLSKKYGLEPKRMRFVHPSPKNAPNMVLIEFMKNAKPKMLVLPPIFIYKKTGVYSDEINKIYGREEKQ